MQILDRLLAERDLTGGFRQASVDRRRNHLRSEHSLEHQGVRNDSCLVDVALVLADLQIDVGSTDRDPADPGKRFDGRHELLLHVIRAEVRCVDFRVPSHPVEGRRREEVVEAARERERRDESSQPDGDANQCRSHRQRRATVARLECEPNTGDGGRRHRRAGERPGSNRRPRVGDLGRTEPEAGRARQPPPCERGDPYDDGDQGCGTDEQRCGVERDPRVRLR